MRSLTAAAALVLCLSPGLAFARMHSTYHPGGGRRTDSHKQRAAKPKPRATQPDRPSTPVLPPAL